MDQPIHKFSQCVKLRDAKDKILSIPLIQCPYYFINH